MHLKDPQGHENPKRFLKLMKTFVIYLHINVLMVSRNL